MMRESLPIVARKASEIASYLGISDSSYFRKKILANLETQKYLIPLKIGNAKAYKTEREKVRLV